MQPIVVYDTNVLISSMIWGGIPYRCIELAQQDEVKGLSCDEILDEFEEKLITNDQKHLLPLGSYQGILIVLPADFLAQFQ